ncbi:MAG: small multi-drug export protein [Candidatus Thermoplasmatota archaeon]|nr:small multi-drug export protein [Candidatus Thermoplasmatota archaeon]
MAKEPVMDSGAIDGHDEQSKARDREGKELQEIRQRRSGGGRMFLSNIEDFVLLGGIVYGLVFAMLLFSMSSGMLGNSTALDHTASTTFLDIGDECTEITDEPWLNIFPDPDQELFSIAGHNLPNGEAYLNYTFFEIVEGGMKSLVGGEVGSNETIRTISKADQSNGRAYFRAPYADLPEGHFELLFRVVVHEEQNTSSPTVMETISKSIKFEHSISSEALAFLPFVNDDEHSEVRIEDSGPRTCWTVQDLGDWGYLLMGAELGGGRETAMLTGGAAGIPAWWMAFISLSLSLITLLIIYPVMYKIYHQDADDILSRSHIVRVVSDTVHRVSDQLGIEIDDDLFKTEVRDLSIDIMVPYKNTENTLSDSAEVRAELLRSLLEEFAIFRVFKPVQLNVRVIGDGQNVDFDSGVGIGARNDEADLNSEQQDYSSFFSELHSLSRIEDDVRDSLDLFFTRRSDVEMNGAVVTSDDRVIFVSVIFRPTQRFAWLRFNKTSMQIKDELYRFIHERNEDLLGSQELVVKTRNEVSTLADRSGAGRVERRSQSDDERIVAVAKQDGLGGRVLQTKFLGDTLSTVEYMANEKREMINKWGFWGLIFFVWIPFMASGVLVGAMLGLLSRMQFMRVLLATLIGGSIASVTWAYTAEGIVKFMHQYKLEVFIPLVIGVFILMAILHIRSTKMRRQTELFEDTLLDNFHADIAAKYGDQ